MNVEGHIHYLELSEEWYTKPMQEIKNLGTVWISTNPDAQVTGDDWDDCPAIHNAGTPYGLKQIDLEVGDRIIIIKADRKVGKGRG